MKFVRILYRVRQFWRTVLLKIDPKELERVQGRLTPAQWTLFRQLQPGEQEHAVRVLRKLLEQGDNQPDLLVAALLHDVGKLRYRLNPFERAMVVVMQAILPKQARRWGYLPPAGWEGMPGWRKAFILAEHHAEWGAEMAHHAGVSPLVENLIRQHQLPHSHGVEEAENDLLHKLRAIDNDS